MQAYLSWFHLTGVSFMGDYAVTNNATQADNEATLALETKSSLTEIMIEAIIIIR